MFDPSAAPHVFATSTGEDFSDVLVRGLLARMEKMEPFAIGRMRVVVNSRRAGRRLTSLLAAEGARLLPRIMPVAELALDPGTVLPLPVSGLRRRLELSQLILRLLDADPSLAPRSAAFDLATSLARLIDEMHEEGVSAEALINQDFGELTAHWQRSLKVLSIITRYFGPSGSADLSPAALLDLQVRNMTQRWEANPPKDPILVVGSTGSRGTTFRLMQAVAKLPQGAIVLPGFDFGQPAPVWEMILRERAEDHPQYRFARLCDTLGTTPLAVKHWTGTPERTKHDALVSLALRPAPVSDQWIVEGPGLGDLVEATSGLSLIEAPSPRAEALAIATLAREGVSRGLVTAVVAADRDLTRMITAELHRWGINADDSAGEPLAQTAAGRLLRHSAELLLAPARTEQMLILLKHPLVHAGAGRALHLDWTRALELRLRREGKPYPEADELIAMVRRLSKRRAPAEGAAEPGAEDAQSPAQQAWAQWVAGTLTGQVFDGKRHLSEHLAAHLSLAEALSRGSMADPGSEAPLWSGTGGPLAKRIVTDLGRESDAGGILTTAEYRDLITDVLMGGEVRAEAEAHTGVRFWGTIEARIQGADQLVLAGLNEGRWPIRMAADPWLNRSMRKAVGLTLPERRIGLSAHDFQQAVTAPKVILSRAVKDEAADTVPSRWLNRMVNLLSGLPETGAPALDAMRARGRKWLDLAAAIDTPPMSARVPPAPRPAPAPPLSARPRQLSVTDIQKLIRDPYAIYAKYVLRLNPLDPLRPEPDARARGTLIHKVMETFLKETKQDPSLISLDLFRAKMEAALAEEVPWPGVRHIWRGRLEANAEWIITQELERRKLGRPGLIETKLYWLVPGTGVTLVGKPDRIDELNDGTVEVLDYKTGGVPAKKDIKHFDRQLMLLALMLESGAHQQPMPVSQMTHVGLGSKPAEAKITVSDYPLAQVQTELVALLTAYLDPNKGYVALRAMESLRWSGDYDHLSRFVEWTTSDPAQTEVIA